MSMRVLRWGWIGLTLGAVALFILALPIAADHLQMVCRHGTCDSTQLSVHRAAQLAQLHIPRAVYAAYFIALFILFAGIYLAVAIVIFLRRSEDVGALFVATFLVVLGVSFPDVVDWLSAQGPVEAFLSSLLVASSGVVTVAFFYLFPDGRAVPSWTRWMLLAAALWQFGNSFAPGTILNPQNWPQPLPAVLLVFLFSSMLYAQIYRFRRVSASVQRQQTKLVVLGVVGALVIFIFLVILANAVLSADARNNVIGTWIALTVYDVALLAIPFSIGMAILRYRLYDIDLLINRALVYGSLTTSIAAVYFGSVVGLQVLFRAVLGQQAELAVAIATLGVAALFNPWRRRIQSFVDRRFYRRKYDAHRILAEFQASLRDNVELNHLAAGVVTVTQETVQPAQVGLWLRGGME